MHCNGEGVIIVDSITVKSEGKAIVNQDFSKIGAAPNENIGDYEIGDNGNRTEIRESGYTTSLISLKANKGTVVVGKSTKIKATTNKGTTVTYKSNKPKIATVDKTGKVTGVKKGKAVISATCCGKTVKYTVTVEDAKKK